MKLLLLILIGSCFQFAFSQNAYIQVRLVKREGGPMANTQIKLKETISQKEEISTTNFQGVAVFNLTSGDEWRMSVEEMKDFKSIYMPKSGSMQSSMIITYDPRLLQMKQHPEYSRDSLNFKEINQKGKRYLKASPGNCLVILKFRNERLTPITSRSVTLVSPKTETKYLGRTNSIGEVRFNIPTGDLYQIDIHTDDFISYVDIPDQQTENISLKILYQPTTIREENVNDTITQDVPLKMRQGTTGSVLVELHCSNPDGYAAANEMVYLNKLRDSIVYKAQTDKYGVARFLLPASHKYMIHFDYERDADVVDLIRNFGGGFSLYRKLVVYRVNRALAFPEEFIPDTSELFIEEFNTFLVRQFPKPKNGIVGITPSFIGKVNSNSKEAILEIGISSLEKNMIKGLNSTPHNLCFVLDVSGSMAGYDRIESLQHALCKFVEKLSSKDKVSLVSFNDEPTMNIPSKAIGAKKELIEEINGLNADGGTNIYDGLEMGYKEILKNYNSKAVNRTILLSDGYGSKPVPDILKMSKKYNSKGAELTTIGVGQSFNYPLLKSLSSAKGGLFQYAGRSEEIFDVFANELERLVKPVASECTIEVEYNSKIVYKKLYGYDVRKQDKNSLGIDIGNVFPGLNTLALIEFDLDKPTKEIEQEPVIIRFSYKDLISNTVKTQEHKIALEWEDSDGSTDLFYEDEQKKLYALAVANQTMKIMSDLYSQNKLKLAYRKLKAGSKKVNKITQNMLDEDISIARGKLFEYERAFERLFKKKGISDYK